MCTVLLAWRCVAGAPVVLAANRDELRGRPSTAPAALVGEPRILGGRDLLAGGTWLAVAAEGRICCVTNRRIQPSGEVLRDPSRRSRGEIPLAVLAAGDDGATRALLQSLGPGVYNPVDVICASRQGALVAMVDDSGPPRIVDLEPGPHVLTVGDLDDPSRPKDMRLQRRLQAAVRSALGAGHLLGALEQLLGDHESPTGDPLDAPCIHGEVYGTVSASSVVLLDGGVRYRHAPGRPCLTPFGEVALR
jgi:uncharacterized protein with NRDE domain